MTVKLVDYHGDKLIGVTLLREYDKQVSVPFSAASSHVRPILAPKLSFC